ncbi:MULTISPECIES: hypothetical protein [unclassified Rhodococcus (in: high G+C Gram-positive bacteria)]|uniref:hypothetical protein n=1 Tax=unclassified Rhodococcus (in: high G+C Gram-positive bacteria) TaxID=192944 RepID=UPI00077AF328|nr:MULTISPECIES: hypothetical protein [unclassified Rhodococcus (in: high G+C Gram-positive bacteria)]KXX58829.1 hypothetical protein AZG88_43840 [Rhodococcus sp. LB1]PBC45595.1 hypothetical protein CJ177_45680 [Rhodococcus sp. ACPA1]
MSEHGETHRYSLFHAAMDELVEGTRAVARLMGTMGGEAVSAIPEPVAVPVTRMLESLQTLVELAPPLSAQFDVVVEELHAQRLTVQALQAELSAFDHQMEVIEQALAPLQSWTHQWSRLRQSLIQTPHADAPEPRLPEN